jgi:hypothetical protein
VTVWCWVRDTSTGHHFDVPLQRLADMVAAGVVVEIPGRRRRAYNARPPKPMRRLGARRTSLPAARPALTQEDP